MTNYTFANLKVEFDDSAGAVQDMTDYVLTINGVNVKAETQDVTPAGTEYMRKLYAGLLSMDEIVLGLMYDDTATVGPDAIFNDVGCRATAGGTRTLKATYGGTKSTSVETIIKQYPRKPAKGQVTLAEVTLEPTGTITEA